MNGINQASWYQTWPAVFKLSDKLSDNIRVIKLFWGLQYSVPNTAHLSVSFPRRDKTMLQIRLENGIIFLELNERIDGNSFNSRSQYNFRTHCKALQN